MPRRQYNTRVIIDSPINDNTSGRIPQILVVMPIIYVYTRVCVCVCIILLTRIGYTFGVFNTTPGIFSVKTSYRIHATYLSCSRQNKTVINIVYFVREIVLTLVNVLGGGE